MPATRSRSRSPARQPASCAGDCGVPACATVEAGTFHSVALGLLRQRWLDLDRRPAVIVNDPQRLLAEVAGTIRSRRSPTRPSGRQPAAVPRRRTTPAAACGPPAHGRSSGADRRACSRRTQALKRRPRRRRLRRPPLAVRGRCSPIPWAEVVRYRFRHLLVDEAQDLNPVQQRLVALLDGGAATCSSSAIRPRRSTASTAPIPTCCSTSPPLPGHRGRQPAGEPPLLAADRRGRRRRASRRAAGTRARRRPGRTGPPCG